MMEEEDPRVKKLQEQAWSLQTLTSKPGGRYPDKFKRESYRVTSRAISLCTNASYVEASDFVERAAVLLQEIEAKKIEAEKVEKGEIEKLEGNCFRATGGGGGYSLGKKIVATTNEGDFAAGPLPTTDSGHREHNLPKLSAKEIVARCMDDPEALFLCDFGLTDSDMEMVCDGLRRGGVRLTALDLSHNQIADAGVQRLVSALASGMCSDLQELWLCGNPIGELGVHMLEGGLRALRKGLIVHLQETLDSNAESPAAEQAPAESSSQALPGAHVRAGEQRPEQASLPAIAIEGKSAESVAPAETGPASATTHATEEPVEAVCAGSTAERSGVTVELIDGKAVRVTVLLPAGVTSAKDLQLDVSAEALVAHTHTGALLADASLPCAVVPQSAHAAFSRKKGTLTVRVDAVAAAGAPM